MRRVGTRGLGTVTLVMILAACGGGNDAPAGCPSGTIERSGVCERYGVGSCAEGFAADGAGGCAPILPPTGCASNDIATPGDTTCRTIGVDTCAKGFSADDGGCVAALPERCDELELASLERGCVPIAPCGDANYPSAEGPALYVDRAFLGTADGSAERPFASLKDAIAAADATRRTILLTDGKYEISARIDKPLTIIGRCPDQVSLFTRESTPVLTNTADVTLRGLTITGSGMGVRVERGTTRVERCRIADTGAEGIDVVRSGGAAVLVVDHSVVTRASLVGIAIEGATATLTDTEIRSTRTNPTEGGGIGLGVRRLGAVSSDVTARGLVVSDSERTAVFVSGSKLLLEASLLRRTAAGTTGYGVFADALTIGPEIVLRDTQITATRGVGVAISGGTATIDRCTIEGTTAGTKKGELYGGMLVDVDKKTKVPAGATVTRSILRGNQHVGVLFAGANGELSSTIVRDTTSSGSPQTGTAVRAFPSPNGPSVPTVSLRDVLIERAQSSGASIAAGTVSLERTVIRDVAPDAVEQRFGTGLTVFLPDPARRPSVLVRSCVIERVHDAGVLSFGAQVQLEATVIRGLLQRAGGLYGHGIHLSSDPSTGTPSSGVISQCFVAGAFEAGINVYQSSILVEDTTILGTQPSGDAFGDGVTVGGIISNAGRPLLPWREASLDLRRTRIDGSARAGVSVFEARASLTSVLATCNGIDIDVERLPRDDAQPFALEDLGGNACGCGTPTFCRAASASLAPLEAR